MTSPATVTEAIAAGGGLRAGQARPPGALVVAALAGVALVLLPIAYTIVQATTVNVHDAVALLFRPLVGALLVNTLFLVVAASLATAVIGVATAWLVERTDLPGRNVWSVLVAAPLAIPPFITSYAWVSMSNALQDFAGALLVVTCAYYPLVYLPVAAALRGLDPALEETARSLGESAWGCFLRIVLPQLRPALLGGVLLVALDTLTEFGAFALLRFRTFTTELYAQYRTGLDGPETSVLALVLVALCLMLLYAELRVRGDRRYARVGAGDETKRRADAARLDPRAGSRLLQRARRRDARGSDRHDRLLALPALRKPRPRPWRRRLRRSPRDAEFRGLWGEGRCGRAPACRADRLSCGPIPEPLDRGSSSAPPMWRRAFPVSSSRSR